MDLFLVLFVILFPIIGGIGVYFIGNKYEKIREYIDLGIENKNFFEESCFTSIIQLV